jgi:hypothetical protein
MFGEVLFAELPWHVWLVHAHSQVEKLSRCMGATHQLHRMLDSTGVFIRIDSAELICHAGLHVLWIKIMRDINRAWETGQSAILEGDVDIGGVPARVLIG